MYNDHEYVLIPVFYSILDTFLFSSLFEVFPIQVRFIKCVNYQ